MRVKGVAEVGVVVIGGNLMECRQRWGSGGDWQELVRELVREVISGSSSCGWGAGIDWQ